MPYAGYKYTAKSFCLFNLVEHTKIVIGCLLECPQRGIVKSSLSEL